MKENRAIAEARQMANQNNGGAPKRKPGHHLPSQPWDVSIAKEKYFSVPERLDREPYGGGYGRYAENAHRNIDYSLPPFYVDLRKPQKHVALWQTISKMESPLKDKQKRSKSKEPVTARVPRPPRENKPKRDKSAPRKQAVDDSATTEELAAAKERKKKKKAAKEEAKKKANKKYDPKHLIMAGKDEINGIFENLDMNGNGYLSLAELDKGVLELWPQFDNKPAVMRAYKAADKSGDGWVTRKEFPFFLQYIVYHNNLFDLFSAIDDSDDRRVTRDEFTDAAAHFDLKPTEADEAFDEIDKNGGGYILFDEFCEWMAENRPNYDVELMASEVEKEKEDDSPKKRNESSEATPPPPQPREEPNDEDYYVDDTGTGDTPKGDSNEGTNDANNNSNGGDEGAAQDKDEDEAKKDDAAEAGVMNDDEAPEEKTTTAITESNKTCAQCEKPITGGRSIEIDGSEHLHEECLAEWQEINCPRCRQCGELCTENYVTATIDDEDATLHEGCVEAYKEAKQTKKDAGEGDGDAGGAAEEEEKAPTEGEEGDKKKADEEPEAEWL